MASSGNAFVPRWVRGDLKSNGQAVELPLRATREEHGTQPQLKTPQSTTGCWGAIRQPFPQAFACTHCASHLLLTSKERYEQRADTKQQNGVVAPGQLSLWAACCRRRHRNGSMHGSVMLLTRHCTSGATLGPEMGPTLVTVSGTEYGRVIQGSQNGG